MLKSSKFLSAANGGVSLNYQRDPKGTHWGWCCWRGKKHVRKIWKLGLSNCSLSHMNWNVEGYRNNMINMERLSLYWSRCVDFISPHTAKEILNMPWHNICNMQRKCWQRPNSRGLYVNQAPQLGREPCFENKHGEVYPTASPHEQHSFLTKRKVWVTCATVLDIRKKQTPTSWVI